MDSTSERNFKAIQQAVNIMESRLQEQEIRLNQLHSLIAEQHSIMIQLQQHVNVMRAISGGHGSTVN